MTPLQMARQECANYVDTGCIFREPQVCLLAEPGTRCAYFERCVLPLAQRIPKYASAEEKYWKEASRKAGAPGLVRPQSAQPPRLCHCGDPLAARRRVCDKCRARNRRETYRRSKRQKGAVGDSTVKQSPPVAAQGVTTRVFEGADQRS